MESSHTTVAPARIQPVTEGCPVEVFHWSASQLHHGIERPHQHPFDEILVFNKGGGHHLVGGELFPVEDYSIHFIRIGVEHQLIRDKASEGGTVLFLRDYIALEPELPFKRLFFLDDHPVLKLTKTDFEPIWLIYLQLLQEVRAQKHDYHKSLILSWLNALLVKVAELYHRCYPPTSAPVRQSSLRLAQSFQLAVQQRFREEKSVDFYASQLFITPKYLYEISSKHLGKSPMEVIAQQIASEAITLLHAGNHSVKNIAAHLGFTDQAYFSRFLKKKTGKSPIEWLG